MPGTFIADLAVLGLARRGPVAGDRMLAAARALAPEYWQPTPAVIEAAVDRNLATGFLEANGPTWPIADLLLTDRGAGRLKTLLLTESSDKATPAGLAAEAMQFCFLDATDRDTAAVYLAGQARRLERRLQDLEARCGRCPHRGRFTDLWMDLERRRLADMARLLALLSEESEMPAPARPQPEACHYV